MEGRERKMGWGWWSSNIALHNTPGMNDTDILRMRIAIEWEGRERKMGWGWWSSNIAQPWYKFYILNLSLSCIHNTPGMNDTDILRMRYKNGKVEREKWVGVGVHSNTAGPS
jgi:hypothetical protein